ncbi:hypothetical protein GCM10011577_20150 [Pseudarthrobacter polychromogenes]|uniref:Uncharacterized protein n=1 Tax=Pseudarthrobacter polychromogenes TaxID=1676 RepID=A0ABQ1XLJ4_9MICC|nr:hypothetical protein GCM10011577_20150 [Pseudarthrobacter polychromogenes]
MSAASGPAQLFDNSAPHAEAITLRALLPLGMRPRPPLVEVVRSADSNLENGFNANYGVGNSLNFRADQNSVLLVPTDRSLFHVKRAYARPGQTGTFAQFGHTWNVCTCRPM